MKNGGGIAGDVISPSPPSTGKKLRYHLDRSVGPIRCSVQHKGSRRGKRNDSECPHSIIAKGSLECGQRHAQKPWIYSLTGNHYADVTYTSLCHQFDVFEFTVHQNQHRENNRGFLREQTYFCTCCPTFRVPYITSSSTSVLPRLMESVLLACALAANSGIGARS